MGPRLRILLAADTKDWRTNLEEVHSNSKVRLTAGIRGGAKEVCLIMACGDP